MRTIKLTHEEIELIKIALQYVYDCKLDHLKRDKKILSSTEKCAIKNQAEQYFDTQNVFDGDRDV